VTIYGMMYRKIADKLTEFENHKTTLAHNSNLFRKLTAFYFVNNFGTLIYIAFIKVLKKLRAPFSACCLKASASVCIHLLLYTKWCIS
jgi:anoctamin-10